MLIFNEGVQPLTVTPVFSNLSTHKFFLNNIQYSEYLIATTVFVKRK